MSTIINETVNGILLTAKNQRADFHNVNLNITFDEDKKTYDFSITSESTNVIINIQNIKIIRNEIVLRSGRELNYVKGYFNKSTFEMYIW